MVWFEESHSIASHLLLNGLVQVKKKKEEERVKLARLQASAGATARQILSEL